MRRGCFCDALFILQMIVCALLPSWAKWATNAKVGLTFTEDGDAIRISKATGHIIPWPDPPKYLTREEELFAWCIFIWCMWGWQGVNWEGWDRFQLFLQFANQNGHSVNPFSLEFEMATATGLSSYGYATVLLVHFSICATGKCKSALPLGKKVPRHFPTPSSERLKSGFLNNQEKRRA